MPLPSFMSAALARAASARVATEAFASNLLTKAEGYPVVGRGIQRLSSIKLDAVVSGARLAGRGVAALFAASVAVPYALTGLAGLAMAAFTVVPEYVTKLLAQVGTIVDETYNRFAERAAAVWNEPSESMAPVRLVSKSARIGASFVRNLVSTVVRVPASLVTVIPTVATAVSIHASKAASNTFNSDTISTMLAPVSSVMPSWLMFRVLPVGLSVAVANQRNLKRAKENQIEIPKHIQDAYDAVSSLPQRVGAVEAKVAAHAADVAEAKTAAGEAKADAAAVKGQVDRHTKVLAMDGAGGSDVLNAIHDELGLDIAGLVANPTNRTFTRISTVEDNLAHTDEALGWDSKVGTDGDYTVLRDLAVVTKTVGVIGLFPGLQAHIQAAEAEEEAAEARLAQEAADAAKLAAAGEPKTGNTPPPPAT